MNTYDVVIIGAGPGGYVAAIAAAQAGLKVALVEKDKQLGGTCLLRGCIPTKSLLHSADVLENARHAHEHGVHVGDVRVDFSAMQQVREKIIAKSAAGVAYLMKQNNITVHTGHGRLRAAHTVEVRTDQGTSELQGHHIIIASGSAPRSLPIAPFDGQYILSSTDLLNIKEPPKSLLILGAGAVGVEFASIFHRLGTACTVVEMLNFMLPNEDQEVSQEFEKCFKKRGITPFTATRCEAARVQEGQVVATLTQGEKTWTQSAAAMLVAVGRVPVTAGLGLESVGIKVDKTGFVEIDQYMRTAVPHIYAIGDIVRTPQLAHTASAEGLLAVAHLAGREAHPINYLFNPGATYSDPEVASVGLTENAAKAAGHTVKVGKFPFSALGKARIMGQPEGFVKIIADAKYDEILGVHIIGPRATDLIAEACAAMRLECTATELAHTIHPHPTLTEAIAEAAHGVIGRPLHL